MLSPELFSALSNRSLFDNQHASELVNQARPVLNALAKWLRERIYREGDRITTQKRLDKILEDVRKRASKDYSKLSSQYLQDFNELAADESEFVAAAMATVVLGAVRKPGKVRFEPIVVDGKAYRFKDFVGSIEGWTDEIAGAISAGYYEGQSTSQITSVVIGTRDAQYQDGLVDRSRRGIEQVVRTAITDVSTQARLAVIADNDDICYGYRIVATLDTKTSAICRGWDQTVIRNDAKYKPRPPFHFNAVAQGEKVRTASGLKPIEDIEAGEYVLTHKGRFKKVLNTMRKRPDADFVRVIRTNTGRVIRVTDEHPVLLAGKGWVRADVIKVGDNLFQNQRKNMKPAVGPSIAEGDSYNYPSAFDGDEVFSKVDITSTCVPPTIDLYYNFPFGESEIRYSIIGDMLPNIVCESNRIKPINKPLLSNDIFPKLSFPVPLNIGFVARFCAQWVSFLHSFRMPFINIASLFGQSISPMILANTYASRYLLASCDRSGLTPAHRLDPVDFTPPAHSSIRQAKLTLNFPESFSQAKMVGVEESGKIGFISKLKHEITSCVVESISIVANKEDVYNLEVEDDNSYLVDDVVVHNCRTGVVPEIRGAALNETGATRASAMSKDSRGQVPAQTQYYELLKQQPAALQDRVLGKGRGLIFRNSGLSAEEFRKAMVDQMGRPKTLAEMAEDNATILRYMENNTFLQEYLPPSP